MKKYVNLELEVKFFEVVDVITSSGGGSYSYGEFDTSKSEIWGWND